MEYDSFCTVVEGVDDERTGDRHHTGVPSQEASEMEDASPLTVEPPGGLERVDFASVTRLCITYTYDNINPAQVRGCFLCCPLLLWPIFRVFGISFAVFPLSSFLVFFSSCMFLIGTLYMRGYLASTDWCVYVTVRVCWMSSLMTPMHLHHEMTFIWSSMEPFSGMAPSRMPCDWSSKISFFRLPSKILRCADCG